MDKEYGFFMCTTCRVVVVKETHRGKDEDVILVGDIWVHKYLCTRCREQWENTFSPYDCSVRRF